MSDISIKSELNPVFVIPNSKFNSFCCPKIVTSNLEWQLTLQYCHLWFHWRVWFVQQLENAYPMALVLFPSTLWSIRYRNIFQKSQDQHPQVYQHRKGLFDWKSTETKFNVSILHLDALAENLTFSDLKAGRTAEKATLNR